MDYKNTNTISFKDKFIKSIKKLTAELALFAVLFNAFNLPFLFSVNQASAAPTKISDHRILSNKKTSPETLIYGAGRLQNYIITTASGIAQKLPITNPYNIDISNLDLEISSSISGVLFSTGNNFVSDNLSLSGFDIKSSTGILFKTSLTDYQTGNILVNYTLTESGNIFLYTGSFSIPFETFNPVSGDTYTSLTALNSIQISKYISTGPNPSIQILTGTTNTGITTTQAKNVSLTAQTATQLTTDINTVNVKLVDQSGALLTNTGLLNLTLTTTSTGGQYSTIYSPFTPITTLSLSGTNETVIYYRDTISGTKTLEAVPSDTTYATGLTTVTVNTGTITQIQKNVSLTAQTTTQLTTDINTLTVKLVDQSGALLTNTGLLNLTLTTTSTGGQYSTIYSPFTPITTLSLSGTNETVIYYRDTITGTQTLEAVPSDTIYATGLTTVTVNAPVQATAIGQLSVTLSGSLEQGTDKTSDPIYVELRNLSGTVVNATKATEIKLSTINIEDKLSLNNSVWYDSLTTTIGTGTSKSPAVYFKSKSTGTKTVTVINPLGEFTQTTLSGVVVRNKIDLSTGDKKVIKGLITSKIGFKLTDPRKSKQTKALGKITYTSNPNDGDYITIDKVTYEFDNNSSLINTGRVSIGITDNADSTFTKLRDLVNNGGVPSVYATILTDTNTIYVEAKEAGFRGNTIALQKSGTTITVDGTTLGTTRQGTGELVYTNKNILIQIESTGGIVSLSKTNPQSITGITVESGETMGEVYFVANNLSGTGYIKFKYSENGTNWIESTQTIQIENPRLGFDGESKITKVNKETQLDVSLRDMTTLSRYTSRGNNTVKLTSTSTGGLFSTSSTGTYATTLTMTYASGEITKPVYYKDSVASSLTNQVSGTEITAELQEDTSKTAKTRLQVYADTTGTNYNYAFVRSINAKQFNVPYLGYILGTGPVNLVTIIIPETNTGITTTQAKNVSLTAQTATQLTTDINTLNVKLVDQSGALLTNTGLLNLTLTTTSGSGQYSTIYSPFTPITTLSLSGTNETLIYYRDTLTGTKTLQAVPSDITYSTGLTTVTVNTGTTTTQVKNVSLTVQTATQLTTDINTLTVKLVDQSGALLTNTGLLNLTLTTTSTGGQYSTIYSPFTPITTLSLSGTNETVIYYRDTVTGTQTLEAVPSDTIYATGLTTVTVNAVNLNKLAKIDITTTTNPFGVGIGKYSDPIYISFSTGGVAYTLSEQTKFNLSSDNADGSFSLSGGLWKSLNEVILPAGSAGFTIYYNSRSTKTNNISVSSARFDIGTKSIISKNKFDIITPTGAKVMPGVKTSFIRTAIIDPRSSQSLKAKGTISYNGTTKPSDGDKLKIDNIIFEFDNGGGITPGNILVAIADTSDNTWKKLKDIALEKVNSTSVIIDTTTDKIYVQSRDFGYSGNNINFQKITGTSFSLDGSGKLGGTLAGYGDSINLNKDTTINLSSSSPTGKFYNSPTSILNINTITASIGDSDFGFYYSDTSTGIHTINVSYTENGINWISDNYNVEILNPKVKITNGIQVLKTGMVSDKIRVELITDNTNPFYVTSGNNYKILLNTNSLGGLFSTGVTGPFITNLELDFNSGENYKEIYYKDNLGSEFSSGGITKTKIKATLKDNISISDESKVTVVDYSGIASTENQAHIRSKNKQFNIWENFLDRSYFVTNRSQAIEVIYEYSKLLVLLPGESRAPNTPTGKIGVPTRQKAGSGFNIKVLAVSDKFTKVYGIDSNIELRSNIPGFTEINTSLDNAEVTIPVTVNKADPIGWTFIARDLDKNPSNYKLAFITPIQTLKPSIISTGMIVQLQNIDGSPKVLSGSDLSIYVSTNSTGGLFSKDGINFGSGNYELKILNGTSTSQFYYKDLNEGKYSLKARSSGINTGEQPIYITSKGFLAFKTGEQSIGANKCSSVINVGVKDNLSSDFINFNSNGILNLSNNNAGFFYSDSSCTTTINSISYSSGANNVGFYYKSNTLGESTILVESSGSLYNSNTQKINITNLIYNKILFTSSGQTLFTNQISTGITIELQDQSGALISNTLGTTINLSTDINGEFSLDKSNWQSINSIYFEPGINTKTIYFKGIDIKTYNIIASGYNFDYGSYNANVIAPTDKISFISSGQIIPIYDISDAVNIQLQDENGIPKTNISGYTINLSTDINGEFSLDKSNWQAINSIYFEPGVNTKTIYFKGLQAKTYSMMASGIGFNNGTQNINVLGNINLNFVGTGVILGVNKSSKVDYNIKDSYGNLVSFTKDVNIDISTNSPYSRITKDAVSTTNLTFITIPKNTSSYNFYFRNSITGNYNINISKIGFIGATYNAIVKNKLVIANLSKTINYSKQTSKYRLQIVLPDSNSGIKAKGTISYNSNNPSDGDKIIIGSNIYEFDNNSRVVAGNISIGIAANADDTWRIFTNIVNNSSNLSSAIFDSTNKKVFIEAKAYGNAGNSIIFTKVSSKFSLDGTGYLGGTIFGVGEINYANKTYNVNISSSSNEGYISFDGINWYNQNAIITFTPGDGEKYFYYKDYKVGTSNLSVSYNENGLDWISDNQNINITHPGVKISGEDLITKVGFSKKLDISLLDISTNYFVVPNGKNNIIKLTSTSTGGSFSITETGIYTTILTVLYSSGETTKAIWYKDTNESTRTNQVSGTEITAELQEDTSKIAKTRIQVYGDTTDTNYNYAFVRSINAKQFNVPYLGYILGTGPVNLVTITIPETGTGTTSTGTIVTQAKNVSLTAQTSTQLTTDINTVTVKLVDQSGGLLTNTGLLNLTLTTTSTGGEYSTIYSPFTPTTTLSLSGTNETVIYYRDTISGTKTLEAVPSDTTYATGLTTVTVNTGTITQIQKNVSLTAQTTTQLTTDINTLTVKLVDQSGALLTNTGVVNLTLTTTSGSGQYSTIYSPFTPITTLSLSGTNETVIYYRDTIAGIQTLEAVPSDTTYATGLTTVTVNAPVQATAIGQLSVTLSGSLEQGTDKTSDPIYVELRNLSGTVVNATKATEIKLSTINTEDKLSLNNSVWYDSLTTTIGTGTSKSPAVYFKSKSTGTKTVTVINPLGEFTQTTLSGVVVRNKIDLSTGDKKVIKGLITSKIGFKLTDPRASKQTKALGKITYTANPIDGDYITIDKVTYEFDNNSSVTTGRVSIGITDNADATFTKLRDLVNNGGVPSVYTTILTDTNTIYVEAKEAGFRGNTIALQKSGTTITVDGTTLGTTRQGTGELVYTNKNILIQIEATGGIVSLSKTNPQSITGITLSQGETMGEVYFVANNLAGTGTVKFKYLENGINWIESTQTIQIENPRLGFDGESKITKVNKEIQLDVSLRDMTTLSRYTSRGNNTVKLTSTSTGGLFSTTSTGTYTTDLTVVYSSGETTKAIWYKDTNASLLTSGISGTEVKAELQEDITKIAKMRTIIFENKIGDYYYNNAGIKSAQFNKGFIYDWIMIDIAPYVEGTNLGAYNNSWFINRACATEYNFDANNGGIRIYKLNTTNELNILNPTNIKSSGFEISDYNTVKNIDSSTTSISTQTGGENTLFLYEYTTSGITNSIQEIKNYNYGFSTSSGNIFAVWNGTAWENIAENNDSKLTGIPSIGNINKTYINSNKLYVLSSSKDKSTIDKNIDLYLDYTKLKVIDNNAPEITITSVTDGFYKGDKKILYSAKDIDGDNLSIMLEYSTDSGATWNTGAIETSNSLYKVNNYNSDYRQLEVKSSDVGLDGIIVWRSITNLPEIDNSQVIIRLTPKDNYVTGISKESTLNIDNNIVWEANSSPVIVDAGDAYKVIFEKPATYNSDNTFAKIKAFVTDIFDNPIIGDLSKLVFKDTENNILTGVIDNNNGYYSLDIPVKSVVSQIDVFNLDKSIVNDLNAKKLLLAGKTISNGYLDISLDGAKLNSDNSIYTGEDGIFTISSDHILTYGNHKLKLKVTPAGGGLETASMNITVTHSDISVIGGLNTDTISIATEGTVGETEYNLKISNDVKPSNIINFNSSNIYPTNYPVIIGTAKSDTIIDVYSGSTYIGKVISDKYGLFEFDSKTKLLNGSYTYKFIINGGNETIYNFIIDTTSSENSLVVSNILSNINMNTDTIIIKGYAKKNSVIEVSSYSGSDYIKGGNTISDEYGRFEFEINKDLIKDGLNKLKFKNKVTNFSKYISFVYNSSGNCDIYKCFDISNIGLSRNNYISINGFSKKTELNKSVLYVYLRGITDNINQNKLIGSVSTGDDGLFNFNSLEKVNNGEYIITVEGSFGDYKKQYYINTNNINNPYIYEINKLSDQLNLRGYSSFTGATISYSALDLNILNNIDYTGFNNGNLSVNTNGYFEENIYTNFTGSFIMKVIDNQNNSYTKVIK